MPSLVTWVERIRQWWFMPPGCCNGIVHLNPYGRDAVTLAVDLANEPPATAAELERRCVAAGLVLGAMTAPTSPRCGVPPPVDRRRGRAHGGGAGGAAQHLLTAATAHPRLTDHDGTWHLHFRDDDLPPSEIVAAILAAARRCTSSGAGWAGWAAAPRTAATGSTPTPAAAGSSATARRLAPTATRCAATAPARRRRADPSASERPNWTR